MLMMYVALLVTWENNSVPPSDNPQEGSHKLNASCAGGESEPDILGDSPFVVQ
jgi:hypothetical protein